MKKNTPHAIALRYDGHSAPRVTAKGEGRIARQIVAAAKAHGVPIEQNPELNELLAKVHINDEIPRNLYIAVAQILVFLYHLNNPQSPDRKKTHS